VQHYRGGVHNHLRILVCGEWPEVTRILTREVKALDATLALREVITMREQVYRMTWSQRTRSLC
jgi:hypothetical protein